MPARLLTACAVTSFRNATWHRPRFGIDVGQLRYRHLLVRQMVQLKNRVSGLLMETGVSYSKQRLHKVGYFRELLSSNQEIHPNIRPLLKLSRDAIVRLQKTEYTLVSSLQRAPLLADRIKRLRTVPGVGPITALTWALEMGEVSRFPSIKQAISYCGLCGDEKSSADKCYALRFLNSATNISNVYWWKPRNWRPERTMNWHWFMKPKSRKAMPIERRWP